jgi:putative ABC transport system ATP-binding protein
LRRTQGPAVEWSIEQGVPPAIAGGKGEKSPSGLEVFMASAVLLNHVTKSYRRGGQKVEVLHQLDMAVPAGEFLALMGPSGSGKSTLLNLIGGLDRPTQGIVSIAGDRVDELSDRHLASWRARHIGFVFQLYNLIPVLTAERNVELPLLLTHLSKAERKQHVEAALGIVGLSHRLKHYPRTLSGGEQQRVGIARAIVTDPTLLLCDEPTGDLDRKAGDEILDLLQALNRQQGKTIVMVTHDPHASARASRTVYLNKGQLTDKPLE